MYTRFSGSVDGLAIDLKVKVLLQLCNVYSLWKMDNIIVRVMKSEVKWHKRSRAG